MLAGAAMPAHGSVAGEHGWVTSTLRRMSLEEKIGQLFIQHVHGASADTADDENVTLYGVATPAEVVRKYHLGGVCYFAWTDSVEDPEQITALSNGLQRRRSATGRAAAPGSR